MGSIPENYRHLYGMVGQLIQRARDRVGMTQAKLAAAVSLTRTSITNIERGRQKLFLHTLLDIAAALGTEPASLLPGQVKPAQGTIRKRLPANISGRDRQLIESVIPTPKRAK
jgi:transcriptional regulator with XRE-family HTH domain